MIKEVLDPSAPYLVDVFIFIKNGICDYVSSSVSAARSMLESVCCVFVCPSLHVTADARRPGQVSTEIDGDQFEVTVHDSTQFYAVAKKNMALGGVVCSDVIIAAGF